MPFLTTALVAGGLAAAGTLGGAAIASSGAQNAAQTQSTAALNAAQLQKQSSDAALGFQKQQYGTAQQQMAPWLSSGTSALANLNYLMGTSPGGTQGVPGETNLSQPNRIANAPTSPTPGLPAPAGGGPQVPATAARVQAPFQAGLDAQGVMPTRTASAPGTPTATGSPASATPGGYLPPTNLNTLVNPNLGAFGSLSKGWDQTFTAPTALTEQNDPGYQARLNLGETALNNSAAARGGLLSGGTARDINQFAQDYASNEYGNVYNRALNTYGTNYNTFSADQASKYNRLASLAGIGQQSANQLAVGGQNSANNISNLLMQSGNQQASGINNAAAATASGYQNSGNIYGSALSGIGGNLSNLYMLSQMQNQGNLTNGVSMGPGGLQSMQGLNLFG